jgi:hypothetical protein
MFINDVGQNTWEEINDGITASNYGWNICEGFCSPPNPTYRDPLFEYAHGGGPTTGCAITGGVFYNPAVRQFPLPYIGKYFFADYCSGWIRLFDPATGAATGFATGISAPLDLLVGSDGSLYYLANGSGAVYRVRYVTADFDYDADGRSDVSVFRPSAGTWYLQRSRDGFYGVQFGVATDRITPADYDGDGKTDVAVYRPATGYWYIVNSGTGTVTFDRFGVSEDLPVPADRDGDGLADLSVFRPSTGIWYYKSSTNGALVGAQFGRNGDKPVVGNFDGDSVPDLAVFRPSTGFWYWRNSSDGAITGTQFGLSSDLITPADFDGDGRSDVAVFRTSTGVWYVRNSGSGMITATPFGGKWRRPAPADYDGDGRADIAVFRPSEWHLVLSEQLDRRVRRRAFRPERRPADRGGISIMAKGLINYRREILCHVSRRETRRAECEVSTRRSRWARTRDREGHSKIRRCVHPRRAEGVRGEKAFHKDCFAAEC